MKITHHIDQEQTSRFTFEVWSPFVACYQPVESLEEGLRRVGILADLIHQMWLRRHPKQEILVSVPDADGFSGAQWAELRINPTTYRSYDTRYNDRSAWARATGMTQATTMTCIKSGYPIIASDA